MISLRFSSFFPFCSVTSSGLSKLRFWCQIALFWGLSDTGPLICWMPFHLLAFFNAEGFGERFWSAVMICGVHWGLEVARWTVGVGCGGGSNRTGVLVRLRAQGQPLPRCTLVIRFVHPLSCRRVEIEICAWFFGCQNHNINEAQVIVFSKRWCLQQKQMLRWMLVVYFCGMQFELLVLESTANLGLFVLWLKWSTTAMFADLSSAEMKHNYNLSGLLSFLPSDVSGLWEIYSYFYYITQKNTVILHSLSLMTQFSMNVSVNIINNYMIIQPGTCNFLTLCCDCSLFLTHSSGCCLHGTHLNSLLNILGNVLPGVRICVTLQEAFSIALGLFARIAVDLSKLIKFVYC